jgi:Ca2+-binding RTX toxin-like protein
MRLSIMNSKGRYPRLGTVAALALGMASGLGCSAQSTTVSSEATGSQDAPISVALVAVGGTQPIVFTSGHGAVVITMKDEAAEIYMNPLDSSLMVNGVQVVDSVAKVTAIVAGTKANVKTITINSTTATTGDTVILNYTNGLFGLGTSSTAGTTVNLTATMANALIIKGTTGNDSFAFGATVNTPYVSLTNSAKTPTRDIAPVHISTYSVFLGAGNDTFTSAGNSATGAVAFGAITGNPTVSIYGGAGNDTLVESAISTPGETFSGGAGTDTVDFSARPVTGGSLVGPVYATVDPTGVVTSGAVTMGTCASACVPAGTAVTTPIGSPVLVVLTGLPTVVEADAILDTDIVLGTAGGDFLAGGPGCTSVTLNGGLGNDTFVEGAVPNGSDTLVGGGGTDVVDYSLRTANLTVVMDGKTASGDATPTGTAGCVEADVIGTDVANIKLGSIGGTYTGNALNNVFFAVAGATGASTVNGSDGDDTLDEDTATGGAETFNGGKGTDTVDYSKRSAAVAVTMDGATQGGAAGENDVIGTDVENLYGGSALDTLIGNDNDNDIEGNGGGDTICGMNGNDTLLGNASLGGAPANLWGSDCLGAVNDNGYNLCLNAGTGGTPTTAGASLAGQWCELATY